MQCHRSRFGHVVRVRVQELRATSVLPLEAAILRGGESRTRIHTNMLCFINRVYILFKMNRFHERRVGRCYFLFLFDVLYARCMFR